jgi:hypothetical protein
VIGRTAKKPARLNARKEYSRTLGTPFQLADGAAVVVAAGAFAGIAADALTDTPVARVRA